MPLGIHKDILDFSILETGNAKTLVFIDESSYKDPQPERPLLEITMPGYTKYFLANIDAKQVNTLNSSTIGWNQVLVESGLVDLPDGIWKFKYKICPYPYVYKVKNVIRVTQLLKKIETVLNEIDLSESSSKEEDDFQVTLSRVYILIAGAKAAVNKDSNKAYGYYQLADKLVQKLINKFCKSCK
jgi:hypothetical protein